MRTFLAVFPPSEVQAAAARLIDALRARGDGVSWVKRENLHYTLRFMGELGEDGTRRVREAALAAATAHAAFDAELAGTGAFPTTAPARVLWLGMRTGGPQLSALARSLEAELRARGFERADKPFAPHLTLGRVREGGDWSAKLAAAPAFGARFRVERLAVVRSTLSPGGSRYDLLAETALRPA